MRRQPTSLFAPRIAAVAEVLGVLVTGSLIARWLTTRLGAADAELLQQEMLSGARALDFLLLARATATELILKWGLLISLAVAVGWWHRRRDRRSYGLTLGRGSVPGLLLAGLVAFSIAGLLPNGLIVLSRYVPIGEGPDHWALFPETLGGPFLVYMAVGSFVLVPIVEELFVRGYMQTRLTEDFGPFAAISMVATLFALAHSQYFEAEILSLGMLVSVAGQSAVVGWVFHRTGSLAPCIVAHALGNFPWRGGAQLAVLGIMFTVALAALPVVLREARGFARAARATTGWPQVGAALLVIGGGVLLLALIPGGTKAAGVLALALALVLEWREKRARPAG